MDIGFDTIIYIILGLVFVVSQVAKKKKKAAQAQLSENEDDDAEQMPPQPSVLEQLLGIPVQKPLVEKPVDNYMTPREEFSVPLSQPTPKQRITESVNEVVMPENINKISDQGVYRKRKSGQRSDFDLRQAIIYKAILEQKNF